MSCQRSKSSLLALSATETGLITADDPNYDKDFPRDEEGGIKVWALYQVKAKVKARSNKIAKSKCFMSVV